MPILKKPLSISFSLLASRYAEALLLEEALLVRSIEMQGFFLKCETAGA
jgi:hypothetical protein